MAAIDDGETLESLLNKATSPLNREDDWEYIMEFCDKVNSELEGAQISTKLLIHKIQSPQEREALQALSVLEACVKNCGQVFHNELGKYRFLNELIKVVSPKYLGSHTTEKVHQKAIELLYNLSVELTEQTKIQDAYQALKKQGIVKADPQLLQTQRSYSPPPSRPDRDTLFDDEEKRNQLDKLLKSNNPEDLQAANCLIKSAVKNDEEKMERLRIRNATIEEANNNVALLNEMLTNFNPDDSVIADMQMMKELYERCQNLRPALFRLTSDTNDDETTLMMILRVNDDVSKVMHSYEQDVQPALTTVTRRKADGAANPQSNQSIPKNIKKTDPTPNLLDLSGLDLISSTSPSNQTTNDPFQSFESCSPTSDKPPKNGIDDNLLKHPAASPPNGMDALLGFPLSKPPVPSTTTPVFHHFNFVNQPQAPKLPTPPQAKSPVLTDIEILSRDLMEKSLGGNSSGSSFSDSTRNPAVNQMTKKSLNELKSQHSALIDPSNSDAIFGVNFSTSTPSTLLLPSKPLPSLAELTTAPTKQLRQQNTITSPLVQDTSLDDIFVALECIKPSTFPPITAYDNNGIRVLIHFAQHHAIPTRPDTLVCVISTLSTRTSAVKNITFQAAAPKVMKVKLQPPSNVELPPYNPIFSSPPITQVMVIANPDKKEVKIRYKLDYKLDEQTIVSESGLISGFPPVGSWGQL